MNEFLKGKDVILASASPRRQELMAYLCHKFSVVPSKVDEFIPDEIRNGFTDKAFETAVYLAKIKCEWVAKDNERSVVIGCDTVVAVNDEILGKPENYEDAKRMLRLLSGKTHRVISGVCVAFKEKEMTFGCETEVTFRDIKEHEIDEYVKSGEPSDKAGAYAIQGQGCLFVTGIRGDFFNVVGFPVSMINSKLGEFAKDLY